MDELHEITLTMPIAVERMTENRYLELAEDFKNIMIDKDNEIIKYKRTAENYKYMFCKVYGNIKMVEDLLGQTEYENDNSGSIMYIITHTIEYVVNELQKIISIDSIV